MSLYESFFSGSASWETSLSGIETLYSSPAHLPRSMTWQRSEQKGRDGFPSHFVGVPQIGHLIIILGAQASPPAGFGISGIAPGADASEAAIRFLPSSGYRLAAPT